MRYSNLSTVDLENGLRALLQLASTAGIDIRSLLGEDELKDVPDVQLTVQQAVKQYPEVYGNAYSVQWMLRNRKSNGLMAARAVQEMFSRPDSSKPMVRINHRNWVAYQRGLAAIK